MVTSRGPPSSPAVPEYLTEVAVTRPRFDTDEVSAGDPGRAEFEMIDDPYHPQKCRQALEEDMDHSPVLSVRVYLISISAASGEI